MKLTLAGSCLSEQNPNVYTCTHECAVAQHNINIIVNQFEHMNEHIALLPCPKQPFHI